MLEKGITAPWLIFNQKLVISLAIRDYIENHSPRVDLIILLSFFFCFAD